MYASTSVKTGYPFVDILSANNTVRRVSLSGGMIYCGSVPTYNDLPAHPTNGDMYNITADDSNYVWSDAENRWDKIGGGTIDLSNYYTKQECNTNFAAANHTHSGYVTETELQDLIDQLNAEIPS